MGFLSKIFGIEEVSFDELQDAIEYLALACHNAELSDYRDWEIFVNRVIKSDVYEDDVLYPMQMFAVSLLCKIDDHYEGFKRGRIDSDEDLKKLSNQIYLSIKKETEYEE